MAYDPYNDPQRFARQAAQQAAEQARQASKRSMDMANQAAKQARDNQQRVVDQVNARARDNFNRQVRDSAVRPRGFVSGQSDRGEQVGGRKRDGLIGFLIVLGLIAIAAKFLGFF